MLAQAATSHVLLPDETVIRAGDPGSSMFVVHNGRVSVQVTENGRAAHCCHPQRRGLLRRDGAFHWGTPDRKRRRHRGDRSPGNRPRRNEAGLRRQSRSGRVAQPHHRRTRQGLAASRADFRLRTRTESAGILSSIKRFFGLK